MKKNLFAAAFLAALLTAFLAPPVEVSADGLRVTGKKMEIMPRSDTTVFSEGAFVEHSSFTMTASRIVSRDAHSRVEARGAVVIISADGSDELRGDEGEYSSRTSLGSLKGSPAYVRAKGSDGSRVEIKAPSIDWSSSTLAARGGALLTRGNMECAANNMSYERAGKIFRALDVGRLSLNDEKHSADFRADNMIYYEEAGIARLDGAVRGRIVTKPARQGKVTK